MVVSLVKQISNCCIAEASVVRDGRTEGDGFLRSWSRRSTSGVDISSTGVIEAGFSASRPRRQVYWLRLCEGDDSRVGIDRWQTADSKNREASECCLR